VSIWKQKTIWQLVKDDGSLETGWVQINGYWYFLDSTGTMYQDKWFQSNSKWYYLDDNGHMVTGWKKIEDKDYCFAPDGALYVSCTTPDGYKVDENGVWINSLVSDDCISFVKDYEKFYSYKYDDGRGVITQGYGCTGKEIEDWPEEVTEEFAASKFKDLINNKYAKPIKANLDSKGIKLDQNQFDAIVSCAYNIGVGDSTEGLLGSSLYRYIIGGGRDSEAILKYFRMWNKVIKNNVPVVWPGLDIRRKAEANIFNNSVYDSTH
jgi:lysozyme